MKHSAPDSQVCYLSSTVFTTSADTDKEMFEDEGDDKMVRTDDDNIVGPDADRWWNYSEKGDGNDHSLQEIIDTNDLNSAANKESSTTSKTQKLNEIPSNLWKPVIPPTRQTPPTQVSWHQKTAMVSPHDTVMVSPHNTVMVSPHDTAIVSPHDTDWYPRTDTSYWGVSQHDNPVMHNNHWVTLPDVITGCVGTPTEDDILEDISDDNLAPNKDYPRRKYSAIRTANTPVLRRRLGSSAEKTVLRFGGWTSPVVDNLVQVFSSCNTGA